MAGKIGLGASRVLNDRSSSAPGRRVASLRPETGRGRPARPRARAPHPTNLPHPIFLTTATTPTAQAAAPANANAPFTYSPNSRRPIAGSVQ